MANTPTPAQQTAGLTATPWVVVSYSDKRKPIEIRTDKPIYDGASGTVLIAKLPHETVNPRANAAYIVQCVNGFAALQAQNEALLSAIGSALDFLDKCHALSDDHEAKEVLRNALSRSKEQK